MAKQKFVVKLSLDDAKKRTKALKTAVTVNGVQSVTLDGEKLVVVGDGTTDAIKLTTQLRKKLGYADLISVSSGDEKKEDKKDKENKPKGETKNVQPLVHPYQYFSYPYQYVYYEGAYDDQTKFYGIV